MAEHVDATVGTPLLQLPDSLLADVMGYLSLPDRFRFSLACRRTSEVFNHPNVWRSVHVRMHRKCHVVVDTDNLGTACVLLSKFGGYAKSVSVAVETDCEAGDEMDEWDECMGLLLSSCASHLTELHLDLSTTFRCYGFRSEAPRRTVLEAIISKLTDLIRACPSLQRFTIDKWPKMGKEEKSEDNQSPLQALLSSAAQLQQLSLRVVSRRAGFVTGYNCFEDQGGILGLVEKFQNLQTLSLTHSMVTDEVLKALTHSKGSSDLRLLRISVHDEDERHQEDEEEEEDDPEEDKPSLDTVHDDSWAALASEKPDLRVEISVVERCEHQRLMKILKPSIPLVKLVLEADSYNTSKADWKDFCGAVTSFYEGTLQVLHIHYLTISSDAELLSMLEPCHRLRSFTVAEGVVSDETVCKVAKVRGLDWFCLRFPKPVFASMLHDSLAGKGTDFWMDFEVKKLEKAVSKTLGYAWKLAE